MFGIIRVRKIVLCLVVITLLCAALLFFGKASFAVAWQGCEDLSDRPSTLIINTYLKQIQAASNQFYSDYFTVPPSVDFSTVTIEKLFTQGNDVAITFKIQPFLGAHIVVGEDEVTFITNRLGEVRLEKFEHILSYTVPPWNKDLVKKPLPGKYT